MNIEYLIYSIYEYLMYFELTGQGRRPVRCCPKLSKLQYTVMLHAADTWTESRSADQTTDACRVTPVIVRSCAN
jgi:hypothetical protein